MLGGEEWRRPQLLLQVEPYLPTYLPSCDLLGRLRLPQN